MKIAWIILPALFLITSLVYTAIMYARVGTVGMDLYATERRIENIKLENEKLEAQIGSAGSLTVLFQRAEQLGLTEPVVLVQVRTGQQSIAMR